MLRILVVFTVIYVAHGKLMNLSCQQVRSFVDGHNWRRLKLAEGRVLGQPPATEMKMMVWDKELAAKAAKWAVRNQHIHNPDKTIGSRRFNTGENIYWYGTTARDFNFDFDMPLKSWWDEYKLWNYGPLRASDFEEGKPDIGHYTQMAWAGSTQLGCAVSQMFENGWNRYFVVCNYGPGGNFIKQFPYHAGVPSRKLTCGSDCSRPYGDWC